MLAFYENHSFKLLNSGMTDGMSLLDLGCGWGSVALFMAQRFPSSSGKRGLIRNGLYRNLMLTPSTQSDSLVKLGQPEAVHPGSGQNKRSEQSKSYHRYIKVAQEN